MMNIFDIIANNYYKFDTMLTANGQNQPAITVKHDDGKTSVYNVARAVTKKQATACKLENIFDLYLTDVDSLAGAVWAAYSETFSVGIRYFNGNTDVNATAAALSSDTITAILYAVKAVLISVGLDKKERLSFMFNTNAPKEQRPDDAHAAAILFIAFLPCFVGIRSDGRGRKVIAPLVSTSDKAKHIVAANVRGVFEDTFCKLIDGAHVSATIDENIEQQKKDKARRAEISNAKKETAAKQALLAEKKASDDVKKIANAVKESAAKKAAKPAKKTA